PLRRIRPSAECREATNQQAFLTSWQPYLGRTGGWPASQSAREPVMVSRAERTPFAAWWWTIDRFLLIAIGAIMLGGIVLSLAASPPVAARLGLDAFYFVHRHVLYLVPAIAVMLVVSFLTPRQLRRIALIVFIISFLMVIATLFVGAEVKGARRWIVLAGV